MNVAPHGKLPFNSSAAIEQLALLGCQNGEGINLRLLGKVSKKLSFEFPNFPIKKIEGFQSQGCNAYFVVNSGGNSDADIVKCRAIFYEHDEIPKEEQRVLWQKLRLPEPTFQADTGGKSIHNYWVFNQPIAVEQWKTLQADLLAFAKADPSIKNPSRVMRLAGAWHLTTGKQSEIISRSGKLYSYKDLRAVIPLQKTEEEFSSPSLTGDLDILSNDDALDENSEQNMNLSSVRDEILSQLGAKQLYNWSGHDFKEQPDGKLKGNCPFHQSVTGTAFWVDRSQDRATFVWACPTCTDNHKANAITYRHRLNGGNGNVKGKDYVEIIKQLAAEASIEMPSINLHGQIQEPKSAAKLVTKITKMSIEQLQAEVNALYDLPLSNSELEGKILSLAERSGRQSKDVWRLYRARQRDLSESDSTSNIDELLALQKSTLRAKDILHPELADLIEKTAIAMPTAQAWLLTTLFPALGSAMGGGQRLIISPASNYVVRPIFWSVIVAKSGRKKSPTQGAIVKPLTELEVATYQRYKQEVKDYKKLIKENPDEEIESPVRERFITNSSTPEGLTRTLAESPNILRHTDELQGLFSFNQYKKVGGDEEQYYLSLFNGDPVIVDRADSEKSCLAGFSCVCITGSIQWGVLEKLQAKLGFDDASGMMARFLFCAEDAPLGYLDLDSEDDSAQQLAIILKELYGTLREMAPRDYLLSAEAKKQFQPWQHHLIDLGSTEAHAGLAAVYPKIETYTARSALLLHVVNAMFEGGNPAPTISGEIMQKAIVLAQYYLNQARIVYGTNDPESKQDKELLALLELGRKKGVITARDAKGGIRMLREQSSTYIRGLLVRLVELGYGTTEGEGIKMKWIYPSTTQKAKPVEFLKPQLVEPVVKESTPVKPAIPTATAKFKWQPKPGDPVEYVGSNETYKAQYSGILRIHSITRDGVACLTNDNRITTWISAKELQPITSEAMV